MTLKYMDEVVEYLSKIGLSGPVMIPLEDEVKEWSGFTRTIDEGRKLIGRSIISEEQFSDYMCGAISMADWDIEDEATDMEISMGIILCTTAADDSFDDCYEMEPQELMEHFKITCIESLELHRRYHADIVSKGEKNR